MSWCNPQLRTPWCADLTCEACAPHRPTFQAPPLLRSNRVQCIRCKAHRDLRLAPRCLVCGAEAHTVVRPTAGDLESAVLGVIQAAEEMDFALHAGAVITPAHRNARRLAEACRSLALAKAGVSRA